MGYEERYPFIGLIRRAKPEDQSPMEGYRS